MAVVAAASLAPEQSARPGPDPRKSFYCSGCGRRLCQYRPDTLGRMAEILFRCRCKTESVLRGADIPELLHAIAEGRETR
jgi:hypothetical protein